VLGTTIGVVFCQTSDWSGGRSSRKKDLSTDSAGMSDCSSDTILAEEPASCGEPTLIEEAVSRIDFKHFFLNDLIDFERFS